MCRVVITGIQMEQCCETSARVAADLGYAVDFVTEGTMTFPIPNHDKPGEELGVEEILQRTEYALRRRSATIATNRVHSQATRGCSSHFDLQIIHKFLGTVTGSQGIPREGVAALIIDSFTDRPFKGNPAGVCFVERPLSDENMCIRILTESFLLPHLEKRAFLSQFAFLSPATLSNMALRTHPVRCNGEP